MKRWSRFLLLWTFILSNACSHSSDDGFSIFSNTYDFSESQHGWEPGFSDYPVTDSAWCELKFDYIGQPSNLTESKKSIMLSGNNHSDDLFMYIRKKLTGLQPDANYTVVFDVEFASNAPTGAVGAGGAPGES